MKQKLLYIIMFIAALAVNSEVWGDTWDQWIGKSGSGTQYGGTWYVLYNTDEHKVIVGGTTSEEFDLSGPGTNLTFDAKRAPTGGGNLKVDKYVNGSYTGNPFFNQNPGKVEKTFLGVETSISYVSYGPFNVSDATKIKFYTEAGTSTLNKFFKNIKVPMAQYIKDPSATSLSFGTDKVDETDTQSFTIAWCNVAAMTYSVAGTNSSDVSVSITNNSEAGKYNTATVTVTYKRKVAGTLDATLTITNTYGNYSKTIALTGSATKYDQTISWNNESAINTSLKVDDTQSIPASATSGLGVTYTLSDTEVLTVNNNGVITAVGAGSAKITVTQTGNYKYNAATSISKTFTVTKYNQTITWVNPDIINIVNGQTITEAAKGTAPGGSVTYESSQSGVATVNEYGDVTGVSTGNVTITARQAGNYKYNPVEATRQFTVINKYQASFAASGFRSQVGDSCFAYVDDDITITCSDIDGDFTYNSSDPEVVSISKSGDVLTLKAQKAGISTVTLHQPGAPTNATHYETTKTYIIKVSLVPNSFTVTLSSEDAQIEGVMVAARVEDIINVAFSDQTNEKTPITASITEQSLSSGVNQIVDNKTPVITYANGAITACNAGTAKITFTQAETNKYTGFTSATYSITVSKFANNIIVTLNGEQRNTINIARSTQETISQVALGYTSSSESSGAFHVTRTLGSDDIASLSGNTITAGTTTDGINTWTISQDETYKFDPASTTVRVKVNSIAETESYLHTSYTDGSNYSWFTGGGNDYEVTVDYIPLLIRFKSWCTWGGVNESITVTWKDANGTTINSKKTSISNSAQTIEVQLPENARQFSFSATGSLSQYLSDVYVVRKTFVNASSNKTDFGTVYTDATPPTATITVDWGSSNGGNIEAVVEDLNPHFTISPSTITGTANSNGTRNLTVTYTPDPDQLGEETATITIGDLFYSQQITLTATAAKHENTLAIIGAQNKKVDDVISNVYSSKNSNATITPSLDREGVITYDVSTNKIKAVGAGTATLTLTQPANDYYLAASKSVTVTVTKYNQTLTWDNALDEAARTLEVGDPVLTTNTATASSELTVTYTSSNPSALEVNATTGALTAKAGGANIEITATQVGNYKYNSASITRLFTVIQKEDVTVTTSLLESVTNLFPIGSDDITIRPDATITASALDITGDDGTITSSFASNTFTLHAVKEGTVTLTLTRAADNSYYALNKTYTVQVVKPVLTLDPTAAPVINYSEYSTVTYNGNLKAGYSTIALPFDADVEELVGNDYDSSTDWVAQLSVVTYNVHDGYSLYFSKSNTIVANQPYILHLGSAVNSPVFTNVSVVAAATASQNATKGVNLNKWTMHSNYTPGFDMEGYYGIAGEKIKKGTEGATLSAFRAYITGPADPSVQVKTAYLDNDEADGILELLKGEGTGTESVYDLQGRQLPRAGRGINIIRNADGSVRKVMMRN